MEERNLEQELDEVFGNDGFMEEHRQKIRNLLEQLRNYDPATYGHSLRVGLKAREIARFMNLNPRPALYGVLHDVGKVTIPRDLLDKEALDSREMDIVRNHVLEGWRNLRDQGYMLSAWVALTHHRYQKTPYPAELPDLSSEVSNATRFLYDQYSRVVALADFNDALMNRKNSSFATGEDKQGAKSFMLAHNNDQAYLVSGLYESGVF